MFEYLKQQIANLPPLQRAQILHFYPHLATPENDHEPLVFPNEVQEELNKLKARRDQLYLDITTNDGISNKNNLVEVDRITERIQKTNRRGTK